MSVNKGSRKKHLALAVSIVLNSALSNFFVLESKAATDASEVEQLKALLVQQQQAYERQKQIMIEQGKQLQQLKNRLDALSPNQPQTAQAAQSQQPVQVAQSQPAQQQEGEIPDKPVGQAPAEATEKPRPPELPRLSETVGGVLTRSGNFVFEPSIEYAYQDANRVFLDAFTFIPAIAIGLIDIREVKRHSFTGYLTGRYGVTDRLELEFRAPYVYRKDIQRSRPVAIDAATDEIFTADGSGIGDIQLTARYQLNSGSDGWPIFVGNVVASAPTGKGPFDIDFVAAQGVPGARFPTEVPTGSGYFSFEPSITALYPTDPAVFFANLSYSYNVPTNEDIGKFDPGDAVGISFGLGFGINERASFSLGYSHRHMFNSTLNGSEVKGSTFDVGQFLVGYSYRFSPKTSLNLTLSIGTTEDSPDVKLNLRMPLTFDFKSLVDS